MADVRAFRSGNWSDVTATSPWWNGTAIFAPAAGDNVYANTFTITVDTSPSVASITNGLATSRVWKDGGTATATAGGSFPLNNGITITATSSFQSGIGTLLTLSGSNSATVYGNIFAHSTGAGVGILHSSSGTLNFNGNTNPGNATTVYSINVTGSGSLIMSGNAVGSSGSTAEGVRLSSSTGNVTLYGNAIGSVGVGVNNAASGTVRIEGNVTAGNSAAGATNSLTGTFTIITGEITASNGANGFISASPSATNRLSGSVINSANGTAAVYAAKYILNSTPLLAKTRYALDGASTYVDMYTADNTGLGPATNHVRSGTPYGGGLFGTCAVPLASAVAAGTPVDNTVGTATLTAANVRAALGLASANMDTQLSVLSNLDTTVSSRLAPSGTLATVTKLTNSPNVPSAAAIASQVRTELTSELSKVSALNTDRLAQCATTSIVGSLIAQSNS